MTASRRPRRGRPRRRALSFCSVRALISCGVYFLVVDVDGPVLAHVALDRADGAVDVGDGLPLGDLTTRTSPLRAKATTDGVVREPPRWR